MPSGFKFRIYEVEGLHFLSSENKGADQLCGYRTADQHLCFRIYAQSRFSHDAVQIFEMLIEIHVLCFQAATVFEATALCKYGPESSLSKNTTLHGIGKDTSQLYRKVPKFWDAKNLCCYLPKIQTKMPNPRVFCQKEANGIANSKDPDQTAPLGAV